ncbi:hypothetical protein EI94DRAFT_66966 [Lactarius quietus]|nr:hypothetical protein EI94DRAFT_66966 [Lactarius quietus]
MRIGDAHVVVVPAVPHAVRIKVSTWRPRLSHDLGPRNVWRLRCSLAGPKLRVVLSPRLSSSHSNIASHSNSQGNSTGVPLWVFTSESLGFSVHSQSLVVFELYFQADSDSIPFIQQIYSAALILALRCVSSNCRASDSSLARCDIDYDLQLESKHHIQGDKDGISPGCRLTFIRAMISPMQLENS